MSEGLAAAPEGGGNQDNIAADSGGDIVLRYTLLSFDCLDSTNDEARRRARAGCPAGTVIQAERQAAGRGRRGRPWVSPPGNLYCSLILRPACSVADAAQVSFVTALALGEAVGCFVPDEALTRLKWPNDVLVDGRKTAGILLESDPDAVGGVEWLVVGVGVNVRHFPEETEFPATSLLQAGAQAPEPSAVRDAFLASFQHWHTVWRRSGMAPIRAAWLDRAAGLGGPVTVRLADRSLCGRFVGLDPDGALLLDGVNGEPAVRVSAGDVFFPGTGPVASGCGLNGA